MCVIECYGFKNLPRTVRHCRSIYKELENGPRWEHVSPRTLYSAGLETDWNPDWHYARLLTTIHW